MKDLNNILDSLFDVGFFIYCVTSIKLVKLLNEYKAIPILLKLLIISKLK